MEDLKIIREHMSIQIGELEALQSVYPDELTVTDHGVLADINEFITAKREIVPQRLEYAIKICHSQASVDLYITLPTNYPDEKPEIYARSSSLNRAQQTKLNEALGIFVKNCDNGESCVYTIISWIQEQLDVYLENSKKSADTGSDKKEKITSNRPQSFARYWIYSHHIYSNTKRKDIADEAKANSLTGFCMCGKPGIICIEGLAEDCEYWWQKIKVMNWHKILLKLVENESLKGSNNANKLRKFSDFHEISFPSSDKHNDMGALLKYLTAHDCQHVFKDFFGVEGKLTA